MLSLGVISTSVVLTVPPASPPPVAVHCLALRPVPYRIAREILVREHYLHAFPGGTALALGIFVGDRLLGVVTLGNGPRSFSQTVRGASQRDFLVLTRLWLHADCPRNSETHILGQAVRLLRHGTGLKFLVSYADPSAAGPDGVPHVGYVYQAASWMYIGFSHAMPLLDLGDGIPRHLRSVNSALGTHSVRHLQASGLIPRLVPQAAKHAYLFFIDRRWRKRLLVPVLPYPKPAWEVSNGGNS